MFSLDKAGRALVLPQYGSVTDFVDSPCEALPSLRSRCGGRGGKEREREMGLICIFLIESLGSFKYRIFPSENNKGKLVSFPICSPSFLSHIFMAKILITVLNKHGEH